MKHILYTLLVLVIGVSALGGCISKTNSHQEDPRDLELMEDGFPMAPDPDHINGATPTFSSESGTAMKTQSPQGHTPPSNIDDDTIVPKNRTVPGFHEAERSRLQQATSTPTPNWQSYFDQPEGGPPALPFGQARKQQTTTTIQPLPTPNPTTGNQCFGVKLLNYDPGVMWCLVANPDVDVTLRTPTGNTLFTSMMPANGSMLEAGVAYFDNHVPEFYVFDWRTGTPDDARWKVLKNFDDSWGDQYLHNGKLSIYIQCQTYDTIVYLRNFETNWYDVMYHCSGPTQPPVEYGWCLWEAKFTGAWPNMHPLNISSVRVMDRPEPQLWEWHYVEGEPWGEEFWVAMENSTVWNHKLYDFTVTAATTTAYLKFSLQGAAYGRTFPNGWRVPIVALFYRPGDYDLGANPRMVFYTAAAATGYYLGAQTAQIGCYNAMLGEWDIVLLNPGSLHQIKRNVVLQPVTATIVMMGQLISGDGDWSNALNSDDIMRWIQNSGQYGYPYNYYPELDWNWDGSLTYQDLPLLYNNFNTLGYPITGPIEAP